ATTQSYTVTPYSVPHRWPDPPCRFYAPARRLLHAQYLAAMTIPDAPGSRPAQTIRPRQWSASTTASAPVHRPVADGNLLLANVILGQLAKLFGALFSILAAAGIRQQAFDRRVG